MVKCCHRARPRSTTDAVLSHQNQNKKQKKQLLYCNCISSSYIKHHSGRNAIGFRVKPNFEISYGSGQKWTGPNVEKQWHLTDSVCDILGCGEAPWRFTVQSSKDLMWVTQRHIWSWDSFPLSIPLSLRWINAHYREQSEQSMPKHLKIDLGMGFVPGRCWSWPS